jgi:hypothetical protein
VHSHQRSPLVPLKKGENKAFLAPLFKGGWGDRLLTYAVLRGMGYGTLAAKRMFEKYWANRIRYYTNEVHLRGLRENKEFLTCGGR